MGNTVKGFKRNLVGLDQFGDICSLRQPSRALPPQAASHKKVQNEIHVCGEELFLFRCFHIWLRTICSITLHRIHVSDIGL